MLALISPTGPDKNGWKYQVKSNLGDNGYPPAERPTWLSQIMEDPLSHRGTKKWGQKVQFRVESILFETNSKVEIN